MGRGKAKKSLDLIDASIRILREIHPATVRAVCYRLFVEGLIPSVEKPNTSRVSRELVYARENDLIPWEWIVDETRRPESVSTWRDPQELFHACARQYRRDYWAEQSEWIELWSEKGTVRGTLAPVLDEFGITFRVMHGYGSATALHDIAAMVQHAEKALTVLYVGDRDPSGMHMSEIDLPDRLERYAADMNCINIFRVAIAEEDVIGTDVPSFPATDKTADGRYQWYVDRYGPRCWELDALSPPILRQRIQDEIEDRLDLDSWEHAIAIEAVEKKSLTDYLAAYPGISGHASKYDNEAAP